MRILLIAGGWSTEREISLQGALSMESALRSLGHTVTLFDLQNFDDLSDAAGAHDVALINLHGEPGEDGLVQAMLDRLGVPYQGTGPAGSFLALHKACAKQLVSRAGILTPRYVFLPSPPADGWTLPDLPYPLFVKSETGGSSIHLAKVEDPVQLGRVMQEIFDAGCGVLVEECIEGREVTCGILGEEAMPPVLIDPLQGSFFDYTSKYVPDGARELCPAPLDEEILGKIREDALLVHRTLGLEGLSRSDFILDAQDRLYFLEVNTLPGMTRTSLVPKEALAMGMDFPALLERFIDFALKKRPAGRA